MRGCESDAGRAARDQYAFQARLRADLAHCLGCTKMSRDPACTAYGRAWGLEDFSLEYGTPQPRGDKRQLSVKIAAWNIGAESALGQKATSSTHPHLVSSSPES